MSTEEVVVVCRLLHKLRIAADVPSVTNSLSVIQTNVETT